MPTAPTRARKKPATRRKKNVPASEPLPCTSDVWQRTGMLVEILLQVMEREIGQPGERSAQWERLFGSKDSAVVTLQKLVQVLTELQSRAPLGTLDGELVEPVSAEEMALLREWMEGEPAP